jgi:biopolymer transport protein TolR
MARRKRKVMAEINVVPYIDVMLVLLVIFMITAPLLSQGVKVDLPQAPAEPMPPDDQEPVVISVDRDGNFYINFGENQDDPVAAEVLVNRVAALRRYAAEQNRKPTPVYVKGDRGVPYGKVVHLMALLQGAGVEGVGLVTEPVEQ